MSDPVVLLSTGDVVGPAGGVTDNSMVLFSGTSGKLIKGNNAVVTAAGLALLDDVDAAAQRVTLGLGTAATANVTTSAIDTTAGRLTKVGDFGLGSVAISLGYPNLNAPNPYASGLYYANSPTNQPAGESNGYFIQEVLAGNYTRQTFVGVVTGKTYTRVLNNSVWTAWVEIWTTANLVKQTDKYDATAGSVLTVGAFGLGGTQTWIAHNLNTLVNTGVYYCQNTSTNTPSTDYGHLQVYGGADTNYCVQTWHKVGSPMSYMRYLQAGVWTAWVKLAKTNSETFTGTTTFSGNTDTSGLVSRYKGGNPTTANQGLGVSSDGSSGEHCFGARAYSNVTGYSCYFGRVDGVNPAFAHWYYLGSPVGTITTNGSSTSYNTTSDYRLKADVTDLGYSLERIQGLKPKAYRWLATDKWGAGFLAHELAVVMPDAVTGEKDAVKSILDEAGEVIGEEVVPQVVDYSKIVVYLVGAIQEQQAQIDSLVSRIAKLEDTTA